MIKGYDNFFTSKFQNITEGFTVDEDIPGENSIPSDTYTNPIISNINRTTQNISNIKNRNSMNTPSKNNLKLDIIKDLSSTLKKIENKTNPAISQPMMTNPMTTQPMVMETTTTQPMMTNPMTTQPMVMETTTTQPMMTEADETIIKSYQELINKQEENDMKEARILASNNKKRNNMNKRMNNQNNRNEINDNNNRGNFKNVMAEDIMEETTEEETTEEEEVVEEEVVEEEFEGFTNIKEGFTGSVIIKNNNTRLLLLTILITILAYLFCHQITKKFIVSNIKSLDKLLKTGGILQDNYTLIHMLLFGVLVFILFKLL